MRSVGLVVVAVFAAASAAAPLPHDGLSTHLTKRNIGNFLTDFGRVLGKASNVVSSFGGDSTYDYDTYDTDDWDTTREVSDYQGISPSDAIAGNGGIRSVIPPGPSLVAPKKGQSRAGGAGSTAADDSEAYDPTTSSNSLAQASPSDSSDYLAEDSTTSSSTSTTGRGSSFSSNRGSSTLTSRRGAGAAFPSAEDET